MNAYEEILALMRNEGKKDTPASIRIGEMTGPTSCRIGKLPLAGGDLLIAEHLTTGYQAENRFVEPLKQGDIVAVYRTGEERYIILERLVRI